jgi:exonuclease V gamma subunit
LEEAGVSPASLLARHMNGDWGVLDEHDRTENEISLKNGFRILSSYALSNGAKIWVITEADRSSTCLLLPSEY